MRIPTAKGFKVATGMRMGPWRMSLKKFCDAPLESPAAALGIDFDGATFTPVGDKVTFEVLMVSFGRTKDATRKKLGALVHGLGVGGNPVAEAAGLELLLRGMCRRVAEDDARLAEAIRVFDSLYAAWSGTDP